MYEQADIGALHWHGVDQYKDDKGNIYDKNGYKLGHAFSNNPCMEMEIPATDMMECAIREDKQFKPMVLQVSRKSSPTLIIGKVPTGKTLGKVKQSISSGGMDKDTAVYIASMYRGDSSSVEPDDVQSIIEAFEAEYNGDNSTIYLDTNIACIHIVFVKDAKQSCIYRLEDEEAEFLGGYKAELIQEAFQRVRGHNVTDSLLSSLASSDNYEEIGLLMANTKGVIPMLVDVIIHKWGEKQAVTDIVMGGEKTHETIINNQAVYFGGY